MSNLYIRVRTGFFQHRKTAKLCSLIGPCGYIYPIRLWAYAAENQPDGDLSSYTNEELDLLLAIHGNAPSNATSITQALLDVGYIDPETRMIHDWHEHNGYHESYAKRAKIAAEARWAKRRPPTPPQEELDLKEEIGDKHCSSNASSMAAAKAVIAYLNEKAGRCYHETDAHLRPIINRLSEVKGDVDGVKVMIDRQVKRWGTDDKMREYLRPATLFNKTKFHEYYDNRNLPVNESTSAKPKVQSFI